MPDNWDLPEQPAARNTQAESEDQGRRRDRAVQDFLAEIAQLQNDRDYSWASDTLEGIYETVEKKHFVTPGQRRAIENTRDARRSRRY